MRDKKGNEYAYGINPEFLKLLLEHQNENVQVRFILEALGYEYVMDHLEETDDNEKVKKYFKDIFKNAG